MRVAPTLSLSLLFFLVIFVVVAIKFVTIIVHPKLEVTSPTAETVTTEEVIFRGAISPQGELWINGEPITIRSDGRFEQKAVLKSGSNQFILETKNFWGIRTVKTIKLIYRK